MSHYKDLGNGLHFLENALDAGRFLPIGCVEITDEEAEAIRQATIVPPTYQQLRVAEYAPFSETADALTKINSGDPEIAALGQAQMESIAAHNMAVKAKYPKP